MKIHLLNILRIARSARGWFASRFSKLRTPMYGRARFAFHIGKDQVDVEAVGARPIHEETSRLVVCLQTDQGDKVRTHVPLAAFPWEAGGFDTEPRKRFALPFKRLTWRQRRAMKKAMARYTGLMQESHHETIH